LLSLFLFRHNLKAGNVAHCFSQVFFIGQIRIDLDDAEALSRAPGLRLLMLV